MSIRDIIEAATPGPWEASNPSYLTGECSIARRSTQGLPLGISNMSIDPHNARFIATFDPEHVALMEAVCEAAERDDDGRFGGRSLHYCIADLTAFRKERGL